MTERRQGPALRFRLFGTPVRVGIGFPLTIVAVPLLLLGPRGHDPKFLAAWLALVTVSVLVHEAGHVAALRAYGFRPEVSLNMFGGLTSTSETGHLTPWRSIVVSVAGPACGLMLGFTVECALIPIGGRGVLWVRSASWLVNIWWSLVNLLPIMPLDGGHVMRELVTMASRKRGATLVWLVIGFVAAVIAAWAIAGTENGVWITLVALLSLATTARYFAVTTRQRTEQTITMAHEQLLDGNLDDGINTLLPMTATPDRALISSEAYTTLAWALLHERRYTDLARLDPTRFNTRHRPYIDAAVAWFHGDLASSISLVSTSLGAGTLQPPDTYFERVFLRLGERQRLAHAVASLPGDEAAAGWQRLGAGLQAAGVAA